MSNVSGNARIARNTLFLYIRMAFVMIVTLYTSRVILQTLGATDYGIYNVVAGFVLMVSFINTSLTAGVQRYYNNEIGKGSTEGIQRIYVTSCYIQVILSILIIILAESVGIWFIENELVFPRERMFAVKFLFHTSLFSLIMVFLQVPYSSAVIAYEKMNFYAYVGIIDILLKLGIVIILPFFNGDKLIIYGILLSIISLLNLLLYYFYAKLKFSSIRGPYKFHKTIFKEIFAFSGWSILGALAQVIRNHGVNMLLNVFLGPLVNAARGISFQVQSAVSSFTSNIATAAQPQMIQSYAGGDYDRSYKLLFSVSKICFFLIYIMALPIMVEVDYILSIWLGDSIPEYTGVFTILVLVTALIDVFNRPVTIQIYATGKISWYNIVTSLLGLLVLPLSYVVMELGYSPVAVYVTSILISILVMIASTIFLQKLCSVSIISYLKNIILPCIMVVLTTFYIPMIVVNFLEQESFLRLVIVTLTSVIAILLSVYLFGLNKSEKQMIKVYLSKFFKR